MKINVKSFLALFFAIGLSIVIAIILVKSKTPIQHQATELPSKAVNTITARLIPFRSRVTAYGNVNPAITLKSMAEVSGKISYLHPDLKAGETIPGNTLVARIDAKDYTVSLKQTRG